VEILQTVAGHDSVIQLIEMFENGHEVILVLELFVHFPPKNPFPNIFISVFRAVNYSTMFMRMNS
jgi:hypothetical protein